MRVLATTHPESGHLHPLVPILRGLLAYRLTNSSGAVWME
jgi:hypothetical protein